MINLLIIIVFVLFILGMLSIKYQQEWADYSYIDNYESLTDWAYEKGYCIYRDMNPFKPENVFFRICHLGSQKTVRTISLNMYQVRDGHDFFKTLKSEIIDTILNDKR